MSAELINYLRHPQSIQGEGQENMLSKWEKHYSQWFCCSIRIISDWRFLHSDSA